MIARERFGARQPGPDDRVEADRRKVERLRAVGGGTGRRQPFDEAVQPIRLLVDHLEQLALALARQPALAFRSADADERRHRGLDGGQRRPQVVRQRIEQRRLELLVAAGRLGLARPIERRLQLLIQPLDLPAPLLRLQMAPLGPPASSPTMTAVTVNVTNATQSSGSSMPNPTGGRKKYE